MFANLRVVFKAMLLVVVMVADVSTSKAARTWLGGGSTEYINDATNWAGGALPSLTNSANNDVIFSGTDTNDVSMVNAYVYNPTYRNVTFDATAGPFVFSPDPLGAPPSSGSVEYDFYFNFVGSSNTVNNSPNAQTFNLEYLFFAKNKINAAAGDFVFNALLNVGANSANLTPNLDGPHDFYINQGLIGNSGAVLSKNGTGTAYLAECLPNSAYIDPANGTGAPGDRWGGRLNINNGNVEINNGFSLGDAGSGVTLSGFTEVRSAFQGFSDDARLTLTNNINSGETIFLAARPSAITAHIYNKSGTNTLSGTLIPEADLTNNVVALQSDGTLLNDKLVISGELPQINGGITATLSLQGAGNGEITGSLTQPTFTDILGIGALADNIWNVTKNDGGIWTISSNQTYTGTTTVAGGKLVVNGTHIGGGLYTVDSGAILGGNSSNLAANVLVNGTLAPGSSIDTFTINGNVDLNGTLDVEYNSTLNTIDLLNVSGTLDLDGATISFTDLQPGLLSLTPHVFATYGVLTGNPAIEVGVPAGFMVNYTYGGNSIALVPVPEPTTLVLFGSLLPACLFSVRRHRRLTNMD